MEVIVADTVITTPDSTFNCIYYKNVYSNAPNPPTVYYYFYAPQAGLIMWEIFYESWIQPPKLWARWTSLDILIQ